jgi:hypothetical protein
MINTCSSAEQLEKSRIYCPTCNHDYALYKLVHSCNPLIPCAAARVKYEERYLPDIVMCDKPVLECNYCELIRKESTAPHKNICPRCLYAGLYVSDDTKLCPVCINQAREETASEPKISDLGPITSVIQPSPATKTLLILHVILSCTEYNPLSGVCGAVKLTGYTHESVTTDTWFPIYWLWGGIDGPSGPDYSYMCKSLHEFIVSLQPKYAIQWQFDKQLDKIWLVYLFNKYHPDGLIDIPQC